MHSSVLTKNLIINIKINININIINKQTTC